jgi:hypothetical protein
MPFGATRFSEALRMGTEVFHALKSVQARPLDLRGRRGRLAPTRLELRGDRALPRPSSIGPAPGRDVRTPPTLPRPSSSRRACTTSMDGG